MANDPVIISSYSEGRHNADLENTISRIDREATWADLSTVMLTPTGNAVPMRVVACWENIILPPNNRFVRLTGMNMEVGESYTRMIESILAHPDLSTWKYILTREHDNMPPPDGFVKLAQRMEEHPEFAAIGGLYFTKGHGTGVAQIWGNPNEHPLNFRPQKPDLTGNLVECNGLGMGWTLLRISVFKDERLRRPWFKTVASAADGVGTQDLYWASDAKKHGYRFAVDCSVKVGHYDSASDTVF